MQLMRLWAAKKALLSEQEALLERGYCVLEEQGRNPHPLRRRPGRGIQVQPRVMGLAGLVE